MIMHSVIIFSRSIRYCRIFIDVLLRKSGPRFGLTSYGLLTMATLMQQTNRVQ